MEIDIDRLRLFFERRLRGFLNENTVFGRSSSPNMRRNGGMPDVFDSDSEKEDEAGALGPVHSSDMQSTPKAVRCGLCQDCWHFECNDDFSVTADSVPHNSCRR